LYILCAYNKNDINSVESALKYFIVGTFSSVFILLGIVLLYSLLNTFNMHDISFFIEMERLSIINHLDTLFIAISFFMLGILVKVYAAPFQF
jgi:NADH-quinone oxidoreductase subunit N